MDLTFFLLAILIILLAFAAWFIIDQHKHDRIVASLVKDLKAANSELQIEGGLLDPEIYNNHKVKEALNEAIARGVKIRVTAGPVIEVDKENRTNIIVELAKKGSIELYQQRKGKVELIRPQDIDKSYASSP